MTRLLHRLFSIKANEWEAVRYFFLVMLVFAFGSSIARSISMTLLIEHLGGEILPQMFILIDMTAMFSLLAYANYTKKFSGLHILAVFLAGGGLFALLARFLFFLPYAWVYGLFFVGFFLFYVLISIHIGSVIAAYFNTVQLKRVTGVINAGLPIGGMMGGMMLIFLLKVVNNPEWLILFMSLAYAVAFMLLSVISKKLTPIRSGHEKKASTSTTSPLQEMQRAFFFIIHSKLMLYMALGLMFFVISSKLLEYQYQALIYPSEYPETKERAAFFATYEVFGNLAWLILQLFVTSRLIMKMGVGASNLLHPVLMFLVSMGLLFRFGFVAGVIAQFVNQEMRGALRTPANNLLFNAVPPNMWGMTKAFINGIAFPLATLIASLMLMLIKVHLSEPAQMFLLPLLALIFAAIGLFVALPQWAAYNEGVFGLLNRNLFAHNSKGKVGKLDSLSKNVEEHLYGDNPQETIAALEMIRVVKLRHFIHPVGQLLAHTENIKIKRYCIETLSAMPGAENVASYVLSALKTEHDPQMIGLMIRTLGQQDLSREELCQKIEKFLLHPRPQVFTETFLCLYNNPHYPHKIALEGRLLVRLEHPELSDFALYLQALGEMKKSSYSALVTPFLDHQNLAIRLAAFKTYINLLKGHLDFYKHHFIKALDSPSKEMKIVALQALKDCSPPDDWQPIIRLLGAKDRILVKESKELLHLRLTSAKEALIEEVFTQDIAVDERFEVLSLAYTLLNHEQRQQLKQQADVAFQAFVRHTALLMLYRCHETDSPTKSLVEKILKEMANHYLYTLLTELTYLANESREFYFRISRGLLSDNKANQGNALEVLSNAGEKYLIERIMRYYEERPSTIEQIEHIHQDLFTQALGVNVDNYREQLMQYNHPLLKAALHYSAKKSFNHLHLLYEEEDVRALLGVVN